MVTSKIILILDNYLNEVYPIPYFFDIITNEKLKEHIDSEVILYMLKII